MTIRPIEDLHKDKIEIDLTGPGGNAFALIGLANQLAKKMHLDGEMITKKMMAGDYENLIIIFDMYFGDVVDLYR